MLHIVSKGLINIRFSDGCIYKLQILSLVLLAVYRPYLCESPASLLLLRVITNTLGQLLARLSSPLPNCHPETGRQLSKPQEYNSCEEGPPSQVLWPGERNSPRDKSWLWREGVKETGPSSSPAFLPVPHTGWNWEGGVDKGSPAQQLSWVSSWPRTAQQKVASTPESVALRTEPSKHISLGVGVGTFHLKPKFHTRAWYQPSKDGFSGSEPTKTIQTS